MQLPDQPRLLQSATYPAHGSMLSVVQCGRIYSIIAAPAQLAAAGVGVCEGCVRSACLAVAPRTVLCAGVLQAAAVTCEDSGGKGWPAAACIAAAIRPQSGCLQWVG